MIIIFKSSFLHQRQLMVSHWCLSDKKSPQVSKTLLSNLADHKNTVVCMISIRPVISKSSSPCTNPLVTVPRVPITIGITVTLMFHSFFNSLRSSGTYPSFVVRRDSNVHNSASSHFFADYDKI